MHLGQVRLQFSWPPLFFARIAYIDRQFAERSYLEAPLNPHRAHSRFVPRRPCPSCVPPPATPAHAQGALTRAQIQSHPITLAPMVGAVNLGLTELATISSYNISELCDIL